MKLEHVRQEAKRLVRREGLLAPAFSYRVWPHLRNPGVEALAASACTIGPALEGRVSSLFRSGERLLALELDSLGNQQLFCLVRKVLGAIRREAAGRGHRLGDEQSPGDPTLPLEEQETLLELAGAQEKGIVASPRGLLYPLKSMSFIVPLGPALRKTAGGPCRRCPSRPRCAAQKASKRR